MRPKLDEPCSAQLNIKLKADEKKLLEEIARQEHRSVAQVGRLIMQEYLHNKQQNGAAVPGHG